LFLQESYEPTIVAGRQSRNRELSSLYDEPASDVRLPSLARGRLEGHAYRWTIILPLLSETGDEVFSVDRDIGAITRLLDVRFGGCTTNAPTPQPPLHGSWMPDRADQPAIDRNTAIVVYSRQLEAADLFFQYLKSVLKLIGQQQEILIERASVWLPSALPVPRVKR
jgi:hypothetical protein